MRPEDNNVTAALSMTGSATGPQTEEHRKAGRAGHLVLGWSVVFMAIAVLSYALGYSAIWWATAGICVALFIIGILLVLESERQRQRRDKRGQPPSMARERKTMARERKTSPLSNAARPAVPGAVSERSADTAD